MSPMAHAWLCPKPSLPPSHMSPKAAAQSARGYHTWGAVVILGGCSCPGLVILGGCSRPGHPPPHPQGMELPGHPSPTAVGTLWGGGGAGGGGIAAARPQPAPDHCLLGQAQPRSTCPRCAMAVRWWTPRRRPCEGQGGQAVVLLLLPTAALHPGSLPRESSARDTASSGARGSQEAQPPPQVHVPGAGSRYASPPPFALSHVTCPLSPALSPGA